MKRSLAIILTLFTLTSCVESVIGSVVVGGVLVARQKSIKDSFKDTKTEIKIKRQFADKQYTNLFSDIKINVNEGRVLLTGRVKEKAVAIKAIKLTWQVLGIKEVINEINVTQEESHKVRDALLATQVKSRLLLNKNVSAFNFNVEVNDGTVYLLGAAKDRRELRNAAKIASQVKGVKKVISHVKSR
jgi:osmotically-inducible protein OsmY